MHQPFKEYILSQTLYKFTNIKHNKIFIIILIATNEQIANSTTTTKNCTKKENTQKKRTTHKTMGQSQVPRLQKITCQPKRKPSHPQNRGSQRQSRHQLVLRKESRIRRQTRQQKLQDHLGQSCHQSRKRRSSSCQIRQQSPPQSNRFHPQSHALPPKTRLIQYLNSNNSKYHKLITLCDFLKSLSSLMTLGFLYFKSTVDEFNIFVMSNAYNLALILTISIVYENLKNFIQISDHFLTVSSPLFSFFWTSLGFILLTVQPTDKHAPSTWSTVPVKFLESDLSSTAFAILTTCSRVRLPLWVTFLTFFLSLSQSPSSLMMRAEEEGRMLISAFLFWHLSSTITLIPFHFPLSLMISSPTFLALRPNGPSFGANVAAGPDQPPKTLILTDIKRGCTESDFGGINFWWHQQWLKILQLIFFEIFGNLMIKQSEIIIEENHLNIRESMKSEDDCMGVRECQWSQRKTQNTVGV